MLLLILTSSLDQTADYLCERLKGLPVPTFRLDTDLFQHEVRVSYRVGSAEICIGGQRLCASQVSDIWFRRPRRLQISRSADPAENAHLAGEAAEALEGFLAHVDRERWMNHPASNAMASHKMEQLTRADQFGLRIPRSLVSSDSLEVEKFRQEARSLIAKPLASGWIERADGQTSSIIYTSDLSQTSLASEVVSGSPTLYQERIDKVVDVRVTIVDRVVTALSLRRLDDLGRQVLDIRRDNMVGVEYDQAGIPERIARALVELLDSYSLRFGAIDMAVDREGSWVFFELNPNGQWAWLDLVGGAEIWRSFARAFAKSAS